MIIASRVYSPKYRNAIHSFIYSKIHRMTVVSVSVSVVAPTARQHLMCTRILFFFTYDIVCLRTHPCAQLGRVDVRGRRGQWWWQSCYSTQFVRAQCRLFLWTKNLNVSKIYHLIFLRLSCFTKQQIHFSLSHLVRQRASFRSVPFAHPRLFAVLFSGAKDVCMVFVRALGCWIRLRWMVPVRLQMDKSSKRCWSRRRSNCFLGLPRPNRQYHSVGVCRCLHLTIICIIYNNDKITYTHIQMPESELSPQWEIVIRHSLAFKHSLSLSACTVNRTHRVFFHAIHRQNVWKCWIELN